MVSRFQTRHPVVVYYLFFLYFSLVPQLLVAITAYSGSIGMRDAVLMSLFWLFPVLAFPNRARAISAVVGIILCLSSLGNVGYWLIYRQEFSQSVFFIALDSNPMEAAEFVSSYMRWWYPLAFAAYLVPPILFWRGLHNFALLQRTRLLIAAMVAVVIFFPFAKRTAAYGLSAGIRHLGNRLEPASPWNTIIGFIKYREQLAEMEKFIADAANIPSLDNMTQSQANRPQTLVLVISESQNGKRMGIYGYPRETTPQLSAFVKESPDSLFVFNDVVAARPYTIESLQQVLSFADAMDMTPFYDEPNLLMMMKQAGYHITWITNQQTQTKRNTMLTSLSQLADEQFYLNNQRRQNSEQHDAVVLEPFKTALEKNKNGKQLIIVHLLGTHRKYDYRYPDEYQVFNERDEHVPDWVPCDNVEEYNNYDNAILYNDMVASELLQALQGVKSSAAFLFLADHGEDVFDTPKALFSGRNEAAPTPPMYTVPFYLWVNDAYQASRDTSQWSNYLHRPYSTADFIYTMADLVGLDFDAMESQRSILSEDFTPHPRWMGDPSQPKTLKDYNEFIKTYSAIE